MATNNKINSVVKKTQCTSLTSPKPDQQAALLQSKAKAMVSQSHGLPWEKTTLEVWDPKNPIL